MLRIVPAALCPVRAVSGNDGFAGARPEARFPETRDRPGGMVPEGWELCLLHAGRLAHAGDHLAPIRRSISLRRTGAPVCNRPWRAGSAKSRLGNRRSAWAGGLAWVGDRALYPALTKRQWGNGVRGLGGCHRLALGNGMIPLEVTPADQPASPKGLNVNSRGRQPTVDASQREPDPARVEPRRWGGQGARSRHHHCSTRGGLQLRAAFSAQISGAVTGQTGPLQPQQNSSRSP